MKKGKNRFATLAICVILCIMVLVPANATNCMLQDTYSFTIELPRLDVLVSYQDACVFETMEFKVSVFDKETLLPVANANVSFILPIIVLRTDQAGVVFFYAPYISKASAPHIRLEYIESPSDISYTFPLIVTKEGYDLFKRNITVYIRPSKEKEGRT